MCWFHNWRYDIDFNWWIGNDVLHRRARTCIKCHEHQVSSSFGDFKIRGCKDYEKFVKSSRKTCGEWEEKDRKIKLELQPIKNCRHGVD